MKRDLTLFPGISNASGILTGISRGRRALVSRKTSGLHSIVFPSPFPVALKPGKDTLT
jgi:hypothetical protein